MTPAISQNEVPAGYALHNPATSAGIKETKDCTVRALVNATGRPYTEVHAVFAEHGRKNRRGFRFHQCIHSIAADLGISVKLVRRSGSVEKLIRLFPQGKVIVHVRRHAFTIIDGVIHDSWTPSKSCHVKQAWLVQ
jgi:hypothetical protein